RIVTTNFDDHLSAAALVGGIQIDDRWIGPALPLGDAFTGIVQLHGSVLRSPDELVLTDRDFAQAYLTDAWATRFLQRMFEEFTVLFVGYSLDDPIMRYLSLGLPSKTRRYVLTHRPEDDKWDHLGIVPVGYPAIDGDHGALVAALRAWDSRARMGQLDHRARMKQIVDGGLTMTPTDLDYLMGRLGTVEGAREFAQLARSVDWLGWVESLPDFKALFTGQLVTEPGAVLAEWFCTNFIAEPAMHGAALQTVLRLGQGFSDHLFRAATWAARHLFTEDEVAGRRWKTLLATSIYGHSAPPNLGMLLPYQPNNRTEHLTVIRGALRPLLVLKRRWFLGGDDGVTSPDAEVVWQTPEESLGTHASRIVKDASAGDPSIRSLLEDSLSYAYELLDGYHGDRGFDPLSFGRSAIEPHEQDSYRSQLDAVIDALRDYGAKALPITAGLPEEWWSRGRVLFQRLALHLIAEDASRSADAKLRWVLDRELLYVTDVKHETYRVLAASVALASPPPRALLLSGVLAGPTFPELIPEREKHTAYAIYNLLVWLTSIAPDWQEAAEERARLQAANPTFGAREHPDFDHWSSSGTWGGRLPIDPEDFIQQAEQDADTALDNLLARDYSERNFDEPTWDDALPVIRRVAELRPDLGERLWHLITQRDSLEEKASDLHRAIIGGWEKAELGPQASEVTTLVASEVANVESARPISQFLLTQIRKNVESDESPAIETMREAAKALWSAHRDAFTHGDHSESSFLSLNSWPGELVSYWMTEIDRRWRRERDRERWDGLSPEEQAAILGLLSGPAATLDATQPALANEAFFMFAADPVFTESHILPLFREESTAARAWGSFLYHPRFNDRILAAGLLDGMMAEWDRLDNLGDRAMMQHQFFGLVASVVCFAGLAPHDRQLLLDKSVLSSDGIYAPQFVSSVVDILQSEGANGVEIWDLWLHDHLAARLNGIPRIAQPEELARWADAVPFLGARITVAIAMLHDQGIGLGEQYDAPKLPKELLDIRGAELVAHLAERVRNSRPTGWLIPHEVRELTDVIRAVLGDSGVQPIAEAARSSGFDPES
ncbi:MAG TPA: SIR2 family protein, partial [Galbitalea sp.]|nr:SIR2 family protein [Galbitalea sp.]